MTVPVPPQALSAAAVEELARLIGIDVGGEALERVAAGAATAAAAVRAVLASGADGGLFMREPADYLPLLESFAPAVVASPSSAPAAPLRRLATSPPSQSAILALDLTALDLTALVEALALRRLRSVDLVRAALERAARLHARTRCFLRIDDVQAIRQAELADLLLDEALRAGRSDERSLLGVPLAHKDMFLRAGEIASFGSRVPTPRPVTRSATVLQRLDAAGAVSLGALHMAEFALGPTGHNATMGDCRNAWNEDYISGGSSSGSAVAVAGGAVAASLGSDSGGSVRIPAAVNGVFGLKPTYGLVPRTASMKLSPSIDVIGLFARSVRDLALMLGIVAGGDGQDGQCSLRPLPDYRDASARGVEGLRVGVPRNYFLDDLDFAVQAAFERSLAVFEAAGTRVVSIEVPDVDAMAELSRAVVYAEATALHASWLRSAAARYSPQVRVRASTGLAIPAPLYLEALQLRLPLLERFVASVFGRCDVLLTPTLPLRTPRRDETDVGAGPELWRTLGRLVRCTAPFNYLGLPALSMPAGVDDRGLPLGMQIIAAPFAETTLLRCASAHERAHPCRPQIL